MDVVLDGERQKKSAAVSHGLIYPFFDFMGATLILKNPIVFVFNVYMDIASKTSKTSANVLFVLVFVSSFFATFGTVFFSLSLAIVLIPFVALGVSVGVIKKKYRAKMESKQNFRVF